MMNSNISQLHPSQQVGNYTRIGYGYHKKLEELLSSFGGLKLDRVVVDATVIESQIELLSTLRSMGSDLILDTRSSELVHDVYYKKSKTIKKLPWANEERSFILDDFKSKKNNEKYVSEIAVFAIDNKFSSIISPSHSFENIKDDWLSIDIDLSRLLRKALDSNGGEDISIEYPLITTASMLNDFKTRNIIIERLVEAEFDNLWLKISGFGGKNASAGGIAKYIKYVDEFKRLDKPIVSDCVGGFIGLSLLAFGITGAIIHGIGQNEDFKLSSWTKEVIKKETDEEKKSFGRTSYIYFPSLDMSLNKNQVEILLKEKGMKSLLVCQDEKCCSKGMSDMYAYPNEHFLYQRYRQIDDLNMVPQFSRIHYFLEKILRPAIKNTQELEKLNVDNIALNKKISKHKIRLDRIYRELSSLNEELEFTSHALVPNRCKIDSMMKSRIGGLK